MTKTQQRKQLPLISLEECRAAAEAWFDEADDILVTLEIDSALTREMQIHLLGEIRSSLANYRHAMETHAWLQMKPAASHNSTKLRAA